MTILPRALDELGIRFSIARLEPATAVGAALLSPCAGRVPSSGARANSGSRTAPAYHGRVEGPTDAASSPLLFAIACGRVFHARAALAALADSCAASAPRF